MADRTEELQAANRKLTQQIEERERAEDMLRQSQKLEAVGQLTGGIAHDFNNLLGVIIGNVEFLLDAVRGRSRSRPSWRSEILNSALSGAELTRRLLAFARKQPLQPQRHRSERAAAEPYALLSRTLGEPIRVTARLAPDMWLTRADPSQVGDALLNLALNARDAMPHGGSFTIETANTHLAAPDAGRQHRNDRGRLCCSGGDRYRHRHATRRDRAGDEPFFTTKPPASRLRPRPQHDLRLRQAVGRPSHDRQRGGRRHHGAALSAAGVG